MSCKFNGKISAEFTPPKTWVLEKALSFTVDAEGHGIHDEEMDDLKILWKELIKERNTYKDELYIEPLSIQEQKKMKKNDLVKYQNFEKKKFKGGSYRLSIL